MGGGGRVRCGDSVGHSRGRLNAIAARGWVRIYRGRLCAEISEYDIFLIMQYTDSIKFVHRCKNHKFIKKVNYQKYYQMSPIQFYYLNANVLSFV